MEGIPGNEARKLPQEKGAKEREGQTTIPSTGQFSAILTKMKT